jgi:hypothetical protein
MDLRERTSWGRRAAEGLLRFRLPLLLALIVGAWVARWPLSMAWRDVAPSAGLAWRLWLDAICAGEPLWNQLPLSLLAAWLVSRLWRLGEGWRSPAHRSQLLLQCLIATMVSALPAVGILLFGQLDGLLAPMVLFLCATGLAGGIALPRTPLWTLQLVASALLVTWPALAQLAWFVGANRDPQGLLALLLMACIALGELAELATQLQAARAGDALRPVAAVRVMTSQLPTGLRAGVAGLVALLLLSIPMGGIARADHLFAAIAWIVWSLLRPSLIPLFASALPLREAVR